jgi:hypothetical protein
MFSEDVNCYCLLPDVVVVARFLSEHELASDVFSEDVNCYCLLQDRGAAFRVTVGTVTAGRASPRVSRVGPTQP